MKSRQLEYYYNNKERRTQQIKERQENNKEKIKTYRETTATKRKEKLNNKNIVCAIETILTNLNISIDIVHELKKIQNEYKTLY
jgi:hypothetical protein